MHLEGQSQRMTHRWQSGKQCCLQPVPHGRHVSSQLRPLLHRNLCSPAHSGLRGLGEEKHAQIGWKGRAHECTDWVGQGHDVMQLSRCCPLPALNKMVLHMHAICAPCSSLPSPSPAHHHPPGAPHSLCPPCARPPGRRRGRTLAGTRRHAGTALPRPALKSNGKQSILHPCN